MNIWGLSILIGYSLKLEFGVFLSMIVNPIDNDLNNLVRKKEDLLCKLKEAKSDLVFLKNFNPDEVLRNNDALKQSMVDGQDKLNKIDNVIVGKKLELAAIEMKYNSSSSFLGHIWNTIKPISRAQRDETKKINDELKEINLSKKKLEDDLTYILSELKQNLSSLKKFDEINIEELKHTVRLLSKDVLKVKDDIEKKLVQKNKIDVVLKPFNEEISRIEKEKEKVVDDIDYLNDAINGLESANNSYERRLIHDEVFEKFGDGNPKKMLNEKNKIHSKIKRNIIKIETRAKSEIDKHLLVIEKLIIDGSNLCHEGSKFIGMAALNAIIPILVERYKIIIVFDSSILRGKSLEEIQKELGDSVEVHISRTADETILDLVRDSETFVVSNDEFADYFDKKTVKNNQVLRSKNVDGMILINDLSIKMQYR